VQRVQELEIGRMLEALAPCVADVGARGGIDQELHEVAWACAAYGFEPDPAEAVRLQAGGSGGWKQLEIVPFALGAVTGPARLHLPESEEGASLLRHNEAMVERFGYENLHVTRRTLPVDTVTLDALLASGRLPPVDYLKIDVEGAEHGILEAGRSVLATCSAVKIEVSFLEQRVGQPLIWEVVGLLLGAGFEVVDVRDIHRWRRRPLPAHPFRSGFRVPYSRGQAAQCDLVLLRDPETVAEPRRAAMLAAIAAALGYFDFAISVLRRKPSLETFARKEYGVELEQALAAWSTSRGRVVALRELGERLRGLVPRVRSAFGVLPFSNPRRPY
jgi:FkbM family methyltransferase